MMRSVYIIGAILLLASSVASQGNQSGEIWDNKKELDQINRRITDTQIKVDSLRNEEKEIRRTIGNFDDRVNRNQKLVDRLSRDLKSTHKSLTNQQSLLDSTIDRLDDLQVGYAKLLVDYYRRRHAPPGYLPDDFAKRFDRLRINYYLSQIKRSTTTILARTAGDRAVFDRQVDSLEKSGTDLRRKKNEKNSKINLDLALKRKEESQLGSVRRQSNVAQDRLVTLSETARQMEEIIAELEQAQKRRQRNPNRAKIISFGSFSALKGALTPPIKGKIISSFGWKTNSTTNLQSFDPGIEIKPSKNHTSVLAASSGRVVYVGTLRGYDNFVIIEHDEGYFTTYAGLSEVIVEPEDIVDTGEQLGRCTRGNMQFEVRQGREHLDPVIWLDLDEF